LVLRIATSRDDIEVVAVNDPFIDAKYMVRKYFKLFAYLPYFIPWLLHLINEHYIFNFGGMKFCLHLLHCISLYDAMLRSFRFVSVINLDEKIGLFSA
jgi:hypothetical protein